MEIQKTSWENDTAHWDYLLREEAKQYAPFGIVVSADNYKCSNCGFYVTSKLDAEQRFKFCPNCGAKMSVI